MQLKSIFAVYNRVTAFACLCIILLKPKEQSEYSEDWQINSV